MLGFQGHSLTRSFQIAQPCLSRGLCCSSCTQPITPLCAVHRPPFYGKLTPCTPQAPSRFQEAPGCRRHLLPAVLGSARDHVSSSSRAPARLRPNRLSALCDYAHPQSLSPRGRSCQPPRCKDLRIHSLIQPGFEAADLGLHRALDAPKVEDCVKGRSERSF